MHWAPEFATFHCRPLAPGKSYTQTLSFHFHAFVAHAKKCRFPPARAISQFPENIREQFAGSEDLCSIASPKRRLDCRVRSDLVRSNARGGA